MPKSQKLNQTDVNKKRKECVQLIYRSEGMPHQLSFYFEILCNWDCWL